MSSTLYLVHFGRLRTAEELVYARVPGIPRIAPDTGRGKLLLYGPENGRLGARCNTFSGNSSVLVLLYQVHTRAVDQRLALSLTKKQRPMVCSFPQKAEAHPQRHSRRMAGLRVCCHVRWGTQSKPMRQATARTHQPKSANAASIAVNDSPQSPQQCSTKPEPLRTAACSCSMYEYS